jgi:hypothetical protein
MKNEFVPYDIALAMKELGFNEPCLGVFELIVVGDTIPKFRYNWESEDRWFNHNKEKNKFKDHDWYWSAPLYQQVFRWFREKYGLHPIIDSKWKNLKWEYDIISLEKYESICSNVDRYNFETPEEAQDACLRKLIEIVKEKID